MSALQYVFTMRFPSKKVLIARGSGSVVGVAGLQQWLVLETESRYIMYMYCLDCGYCLETSSNYFHLQVILVGDSGVGKTSIHKLYEFRTVAKIEWPATLGLISNITNIVVGEGHHTIEVSIIIIATSLLHPFSS